jgi:hypothetical protein
MTAMAPRTTWVFQARPGGWDLDGHLAAVPFLQWMVTSHAKKMQIGDPVFLWESGDRARLLCRAHISSKPAARRLREDNRPFCLDQRYLAEDIVRAGLRIESVFAPPVPRDVVTTYTPLERTAPFGGPSMARMPTNFEMAAPEADALARLADEHPARPVQ